MLKQKFSINARFSIDPSLNLVEDLETGKEHHLEPRLMNILCALAEKEGELLSREQLISDIWNNYGGAEDSLNQAISFLRKTFQDSKKELIETVPKKGYILHATISNIETVAVATTEVQTSIKPKIILYQPKIFAGAFVIFLLALYFVLKSNSNEESKSDVAQNERLITTNTKDALEVNFSDVNQPEKEDYSNTITTTGPDGTKYRVVAIGDKRPKLYINGQLISGPEIEKYSVLMDQMLRKLWDRQKNTEDSLRLVHGH